MSVCGRCKGKGWHNPIRGVGQVDCASCKGTGIKVQASSLGKGKAKLIGPSGSCTTCGNPALDWHHTISQQRIQRLVLDTERKAALEDKRNLVALCRPCHDRIERAMLRVEPHQLHPQFWTFVREYDLEAVVPRHLAERWAA